MPSAFSNFSSIWCIVASVRTCTGERLEPIAIAVVETATATAIEIGMPKLRSIRHAPYPTGPQALLVTIDAHLLAGCHLALGWRMPERIIDLLVEDRNARPSTRVSVGGLSGALLAAGHPASAGLVSGSSPARMRCQLEAVVRLFVSMRDTLDLGRSLLRGRSLCAVARIEAVGVPVDSLLTRTLAEDWGALRQRIISTIDSAFGVYRSGRLDVQAFSAMLVRRGIAWPRTATGSFDLGDATFRDMSLLHPVLRPLKELRATLASFDPRALAIGRDGRNRVPLHPFASSTGRNQPSAKASVLGGPAWARHLIRPAPGAGLVMIDWQQQEFGIAAALSGDGAMQAAYGSGDPYMALAIAAGAAPTGSTAASHADVRESFKRCALGLQYGVGRARLARQLATTESVALALIESHKRAFPKFWSWADAVEAHALLNREVRSVFGWRLPIDDATNPRSIRNFPMQANGAEMLRLACCLMTEGGITVCAPNHDAVLIEVPLSQLDEKVADAQRFMAQASAIVLDSFALRSSVRVVKAPERWTEPRGQAIWSAVDATLRQPACSRT